ncbi:hypothetical protein ERO13_A04G055500v2 [Gossypium hirsutum]|uniref:Glutaredoxin domain-containing protein n=4 Tax=Gossypium TaxID=3633 RepID=A0ABR0QA75_GOSAR|nr:uncharacterized protein At3g28850-like [Gossypium hirsutum]XP_017614827.1 uncharacterized protein At3g28850 [Gossypium arboreum]TYI32640.1 hypothetical protein ES332_A04G078200v1 [Gossypium tomentosum]TYJ39484.1 hypothetical protein E1A91_A04G073400v1 [Gossypium mustelinum]KAG4204587.1 hypothetical protein ERO13_A04G055500v2 [Gossypium hirsutum]KAK5835893.1 hypothetical protein PVK06_011607 [Gossypium arboreum]
MKGFKGRLLKKLKFIPAIKSLRKSFAFHPYHKHPFSNHNRHSQPVYKDQDCKISIHIPDPVIHSKDQKGKGSDLDQFDVGHQDNNKPAPKIEFKETATKEGHSQLPIASNAFDKLETVKIHSPLKDFEEKCPPGGEDAVVLYTTSLRGIRKTFEDCNAIRYLLSSFRILVHERDVSMDLEFREELWRLFGEKVIPPKLFIKGRYIGGADEVIGLHEEGKLKKLFEGIPSNIPCSECANMRFLVCPNCDGSRKVFAETDDDDEMCLKCPDCNENGLVKCAACC